mgnify:CR=1 FL=1
MQQLIPEIPGLWRRKNIKFSFSRSLSLYGNRLLNSIWQQEPPMDSGNRAGPPGVVSALCIGFVYRLTFFKKEKVRKGEEFDNSRQQGSLGHEEEGRTSCDFRLFCGVAAVVGHSVVGMRPLLRCRPRLHCAIWQRPEVRPFLPLYNVSSTLS